MAKRRGRKSKRRGPPRRRRTAKGSGDYCVTTRSVSGKSSTTCYKTPGAAGSAAGRSALKRQRIAAVMLYVRGKKLKHNQRAAR